MKIATKQHIVESMIKEAEGRSTVRKITYADIVYALTKIENHILRFSKKSDAVGTKAYVDINTQAFPRAYKYMPESTHFEAELKSGGWKIVRVYRYECGRELFRLELSEKTKENMVSFVSTVRS